MLVTAALVTACAFGGLPAAAAGVPAITHKLQNFESYKIGDIVKDSHSPDVKDLEVVSGGYQGSKGMRLVRSVAGTGHNNFANDTLSTLFGGLAKKTSVIAGGDATEYFVDYSVAEGIVFYVKNQSKKSESHFSIVSDYRYDNKGKVVSYRLNVGRGAKVYSPDGQDVTDQVIIDWYGENYFNMTPGFEGWVQIPTTVGESAAGKGWMYGSGAEVAAARGKVDFRYMTSFTIFADEAADIVLDEFGFYGKVNISEKPDNSTTKSPTTTVAATTTKPGKTDPATNSQVTTSRSASPTTTGSASESSEAPTNNTTIVSTSAVTEPNASSDIPLSVPTSPGEPEKASFPWAVLIVVGVLVIAGAGFGIWWKFFRKQTPSV